MGGRRGTRRTRVGKEGARSGCKEKMRSAASEEWDLKGDAPLRLESLPIDLCASFIVK